MLSDLGDRRFPHLHAACLSTACAAKLTGRQRAPRLLMARVDVIASGHDPRGPEDKRLPFADAAPGMAGAETLLAMVLNLVREKIIDHPPRV